MQKAASKQIVTQFELQNLIRKTKLFSKVKLAPATRLVLESLVYHFPNIKVNIKTLEEETGNSRRSVDNALAELKTKGLIITIQTGRSSIFKLTQTFFDLLEIAPQTCKYDSTRHANIALPCNKDINKNINKPFQDLNLKNDIKKLLEKDSYLTNKQQAEIILHSYHKHNTKDNDFKTIIMIQEMFNFPVEQFEILKLVQESKKENEVFRRKIENLESEIKSIYEGHRKPINESFINSPCV